MRLAIEPPGISGPFASPLITYREGGSANNAPGYYKPSYNNFAPRIGFAYSPSATAARMLGRLFGNRETSIRAGFGLDFDNNLIGQGFELDKTSFLFSDTPTTNLGIRERSSLRVPVALQWYRVGLYSISRRPLRPAPRRARRIRPTWTPMAFRSDSPKADFGSGSMFNFDPNYQSFLTRCITRSAFSATCPETGW